MKKFICMLAVGVVFVAFGTQRAPALSEFKKAWTEKYADKHEDDDFKAVVRKASCNVCHVKGAKKDVNNEYGKLLDKLIEGSAKERKDKAKEAGGTEAQNEEKEKLLAELAEAFKKVEKMKSDGGKGPEYGQLIKDGKLPVEIEKAVEQYEKEKAEAEKKE